MVKRVRQVNRWEERVHIHSLLDEIRTAVERVQHDDTPTQEQRETAFDCYD
jgi:hypothetical protein